MLGVPELARYWENVRAVTWEFLDVYPPEQLDFRPVESVFTARDQFQHLIASETMFVRGWTEGLWEFPWREGKWCALDLVERGHRLVADDMVRIIRRSPQIVTGSGDDLLGYHMEIRGLGIINIRDLFGISAVRERKRIEIAVELVGGVEGAFPPEGISIRELALRKAAFIR